jgi:tetratricopeptide (TPR) repeat protein
MAGQILSQSSEISLPEMAKLSSWGRLSTMASMSLEYFRLLVIGYPLRPYYDPLSFGVLSSPNWRSWLGVFGVTGLALGAILAYRRAPIVTFAIGFFFITLGLFSNIVFLVGSLVAERFLYLPSVGYAIMIAWLAERYVFSAVRTTKPALGQFLPAVVLLVCCVGYIGITTRRNLDWANNEALFTRFIETDPKSSLGYTILGDIFLKRGELPQARRLFDNCLTLSPSSFAGHWGLCQIDFQEGKALDCRKRIDFLLGFEPPRLLPPADDWAQVHMLNARLWTLEKNWEKAVTEADRAAVLSPVVPDAQLLAADIRVQANQLDAALKMYQALTHQYPDFDRGFNNYGVVLLRLGKLTEAEAQFQQALRLNPDSTVAARNLGLVQSRLQSVPK